MSPGGFHYVPLMLYVYLIHGIKIVFQTRLIYFFGKKKKFFFDILSLLTDAHFVVPEIHLTLSKTNLARVDWALDC